MGYKRAAMKFQTVRRAVLSVTAAVGLGAATFATPVPANAIGAGLWICDPEHLGIQRTCTTFVDLPGGTGQLLDRTANRVITVHNGDNIFLVAWGIDTSGQCGINGDPYVWRIGWMDPDGFLHQGFASDWYLNTGAVSNWNDWVDSWGNLGGSGHYIAGSGQGTCDVIFPQYPS
jgi:hypothetical protein